MTKVLIIFLIIIPLLVGQNLCDLDSSGSVTSTDVTLARNMVIGATPCTMTVLGSTLCNAVALQRVINASFPGASCVTGTAVQHSSVSLTWTASTTPDVNYFAFRGDSPGGPYTQLNATSVPELAYLDNTTENNQTYYYVVTATDGTNQSVYSEEASATIPSAPGPMQGSLFVATLTGTKGTTVPVPVTLTNDAQKSVGSLQFTVTLPLWANNKATVTNGMVATNASKTMSCKWQKAGFTTIPLKCVLSGDTLVEIGNGVVANINIPLPATLVGTVNIALSGAVGSSSAGDTISIIGQSGKLTSRSVEAPVRVLVVDEVAAPSRINRTESRREPPSPGMVFAPNPVQIPTPVLESIDCMIVKSEVECTMKYNVVPTGWLEVGVFSSNEEYIKPLKVLTGPQKKTNTFKVPIAKIPPFATKLVLGVGIEGQQVLSQTLIWP